MLLELADRVPQDQVQDLTGGGKVPVKGSSRHSGPVDNIRDRDLGKGLLRHQVHERVRDLLRYQVSALGHNLLLRFPAAGSPQGDQDG